MRGKFHDSHAIEWDDENRRFHLIPDSKWTSLSNKRSTAEFKHTLARYDKLHGFGYFHMWKMKINGTSHTIQTVADSANGNKIEAEFHTGFALRHAT